MSPRWSSRRSSPYCDSRPGGGGAGWHWPPADVDVDVPLVASARDLLRPGADPVALLEAFAVDSPPLSPPPQKPSLRLETMRSMWETMGGGVGGRADCPEGVNGDCCDKENVLLSAPSPPYRPLDAGLGAMGVEGAAAAAAAEDAIGARNEASSSAAGRAEARDAKCEGERNARMSNAEEVSIRHNN